MTRLVDLHETLIEVRGDEAREWLDGQLTCAVAALPRGGSMRGLRLGKNGRIMAAVRLIDRGETGVDLSVPREGADALFGELDRYIIMEDVELALRPERRFYAAIDLDDPSAGVSAVVFGREARIADFEDAEHASRALGAAPLGPSEADALRVAAGEPGAPEFLRGLLPQEAGLDALVSFDKGCYLGQEPVVMLEHRGRPPKRLARLRLARPADPGAAITLPSAESAGEITSAATLEGDHFALALIKRRAEGAPSLLVDGEPVVDLVYVRDL